MQFNLNASSPDLHRSVYEFEGDQGISDEKYQNSIFAGYVSSVSTLAGAAEGVGIDIDSETFERWKRMSAATGHIDDFLDENHAPHSARHDYFQGLTRAGDGLPLDLSGHDARLATSITLLDNSMTTLTAEHRRTLISIARSIGTLAVAKAQSTHADDYIELVSEEGRQAARLATESVSSVVRSHEAYDTFAAWCLDVIEAGTLLDHARDLRRDYLANLTKVEPTYAHSVMIARAALRPLRESVSTAETRSATAGALRGRASFSLLPTKVTMRLRQSEQEYTRVDT